MYKTLLLTYKNTVCQSILKRKRYDKKKETRYFKAKQEQYCTGLEKRTDRPRHYPPFCLFVKDRHQRQFGEQDAQGRGRTGKHETAHRTLPEPELHPERPVCITRYGTAATPYAQPTGGASGQSHRTYR